VKQLRGDEKKVHFQKGEEEFSFANNSVAGKSL